MQTNPLWDEIRAEARAEARATALAEGRAEGARGTLLRLGRQKFGRAPSRKQQKALEAVTDLGRLEALADRLLDVDSWGELLEAVE